MTRIPGQIGWGVERKHLRDDTKVLTDDMRVAEYPIQKHHLVELDKNRTTQFTRHEGDRSAQIDRRLGIDYQLYNAMNLQAQRNTIKYLSAQRKVFNDSRARTSN